MFCSVKGKQILIKKDDIRFSKLYIEVTNRCNLKCIHCLNNSGENQDDFLDIREIKDIINHAILHGAKKIFISGGEPFIRNDIHQILDYCIFNNLEIMVLTNGTLLTKDNIDFIIKNGIKLQVTLNGATKNDDDLIRGSGFERTIESLKAIVSMGASHLLKVTTTINKINKDKILDILNLCKDMRIFNVQVSFVSNIGRAEVNWNEVGLGIAEKAKILKELSEFSSMNTDVNLKTSGMFGLIKNLSGDCDYSYQCNKLLDEFTVRANGEAHFCDKMVNYIKCFNNKHNNWKDYLLSNEFRLEIDLDSVCTKASSCLKKNICLGGCLSEQV